MRKFIFIALFSVAVSLGLFSCGLHGLVSDELSDSKIVEALQEALFLGSKTAADNLGNSSCQTTTGCLTGYLGNELVEIIVPDTIRNVLGKINSFTKKINDLHLSPTAQTLLSNAIGVPFDVLSGLAVYEDSIKTALNRGAEQAAPNSIAVFEDAIFGMSFSDARGILFGDDSTGATTYLQNKTFNGLQVSFAPIIKAPLDLLKPNNYWKPIVTKYKSFATEYLRVKSNMNSNPLLSSALGSNALALPDLPLNSEGLPDDLTEYLAEYATGKALDGLFKMVGKQEAQLRRDPWGTISAVGDFISDAVGDLLGNVFSKAKEG